MKKYSLTKNTKEWCGTTLFQIKAEISFGNVSKGDLGGYIEKESNLSMEGNAWVYGNAQVSGDACVYGNAWVSGDACVYGNAWFSLKASFTKGWFIGGDDTGKITDITDKTGSTYWKNQYVLGDYEITPIEDEKKEVETIKIGNNTYDKNAVEEALKNIKSI
jgi:hypothetical protein